MNKKPDFDVEAAHRYFSACFNGAWDLIDKSSALPKDERMIAERASMALVAEGRLRRQNLSVGYWQAAHPLARAG
jgi:hypothetical protein